MESIEPPAPVGRESKDLAWTEKLKASRLLSVSLNGSILTLDFDFDRRLFLE